MNILSKLISLIIDGRKIVRYHSPRIYSDADVNNLCPCGMINYEFENRVSIENAIKSRNHLYSEILLHGVLVTIILCPHIQEQGKTELFNRLIKDNCLMAVWEGK